MSVPLPRSRLTGCSVHSPLAHFYLHHTGSSIRELHPFTTITHLASKTLATPVAADDFVIQFLFRKSGRPASTAVESAKPRFIRLFSQLFRNKEQRVKSTEWTERLAGLVDRELNNTPSDSSVGTHHQFPCVDVSIRLEGPYFLPANPFRYDKVVCLVAGTGISGAIAIATAFTEFRRSPTNTPIMERPPSLTSNLPISPWRRCIVVWSVKATDLVELPFLEPCEGLEVRNCLTGPGRERVDLGRTLQEIGEADRLGRTWVYISGPKAFIKSAESACQAVGGVEWYASNWDI